MAFNWPVLESTMIYPFAAYMWCDLVGGVEISHSLPCCSIYVMSMPWSGLVWIGRYIHGTTFSICLLAYINLEQGHKEA